MLSTEELERRRAVEGRARAYWDSTLEDDPVTYRSFIRSLNERNMLRFEFASQEEVGIFCVEKKNGKLRLIVDCRRLNQRMRCPPRTRLASTGAMAEFQSDFNEIFYSARDISDCFYHFEIPPALSALLGLKRLGIYSCPSRNVNLNHNPLTQT